ncbi:hypothetical protein [Aquipseudomonas alcaligenes]|uniref:Uncharacterized protein n=1 Tax=Aquipseudomonas alcaligenes TaxID=43263 RepID=A0A1N6WND3_AQUAC|nr:hypothetical protein [Pseudomonas alcaligenes]SIQ91512.1 hypothetical protein SAMN05878282_11084 [Pseudomonas alcaligenes]
MKYVYTFLIMILSASAHAANPWWDDEKALYTTPEVFKFEGYGRVEISVNRALTGPASENEWFVDFRLNMLDFTRIKSTRLLKVYHCGKRQSKTIGFASYGQYDNKGAVVDGELMFNKNAEYEPILNHNHKTYSYDTVMLNLVCGI